nr:GyrI-like domain-containing protein [Salirhabdus salicampi]
MKIPSYRAVGLKWDGPWTEIKYLKETIQEASRRVIELKHAVNPSEQLGLSYHLRPDGFTHYSVYEVSHKQQVPPRMEEIIVPEMTYLVTKHEKGNRIEETYEKIKNWIMESEYEPFKEGDATYYNDFLPIKHEKYPADLDRNDPHFDIFIPIVKRKTSQTVISFFEEE